LGAGTAEPPRRYPGNRPPFPSPAKAGISGVAGVCWLHPIFFNFDGIYRDF
jgi:hypothetical protein